MRGTVAKRLRRQVYGDFADTREMKQVKPDTIVNFPTKVLAAITKTGKKAYNEIRVTGQLVCTGLRADYQKAKRRHSHEK